MASLSFDISGKSGYGVIDFDTPEDQAAYCAAESQDRDCARASLAFYKAPPKDRASMALALDRTRMAFYRKWKAERTSDEPQVA